METIVMKSLPTLNQNERGPGRPKKSEAIIKDVKRRTKRQFNGRKDCHSIGRHDGESL